MHFVLVLFALSLNEQRYIDWFAICQSLSSFVYLPEIITTIAWVLYACTTSISCFKHTVLWYWLEVWTFIAKDNKGARSKVRECDNETFTCARAKEPNVKVHVLSFRVEIRPFLQTINRHLALPTRWTRVKKKSDVCVCVRAHTQHINATSAIVKENQNTLHDRIFQSRRALIH